MISQDVVPRETQNRLQALAELVRLEGQKQNLVAASTLPIFQQRHVDDSLQLLDLVPRGPLLDIGSGGGFPGLVLACCRNDIHHLIEPRRKRAEFLNMAAQNLGIVDRVLVHHAKVENISPLPIASITARAVASLSKIIGMAYHLSTPKTRWVLPKGRTAREELAEARRLWHGDFTLMPSVTDAGASIVVATNVVRR